MPLAMLTDDAGARVASTSLEFKSLKVGDVSATVLLLITDTVLACK